MACDWTHFGDYFQRLEAHGLGTNTATLVGHGNVRVAAMGYDDRPPTAAEMEQMKALVARAMEDGAMGLSSGLAYAPGPYAALEELVELGKVVAEYGGIYTSHIRNQTESIAQAVGEVIAVGEQAAVAAHVSHMQPGAPMIGATRDLLATIDQKRREGCDISCDAHSLHDWQHHPQVAVAPLGFGRRRRGVAAEAARPGDPRQDRAGHPAIRG